MRRAAASTLHWLADRRGGDPCLCWHGTFTLTCVVLCGYRTKVLRCIELRQRRLTFDMSGGARGAKRPLGRPLDGGVRRLVHEECRWPSLRLTDAFGSAPATRAKC